jgi:four helix bundle protein
MDAIANHRDWIVWQHAIALASALHATARGELPNCGALREQMKTSSIAVATHIAESATVANRSERIRVLCAARTLLARMEVQLQICERMQLANDFRNVNEQIVALCRLLDGVIQRSREQPNRDARSAVSRDIKRPIAPLAGAVPTPNYSRPSTSSAS